MKKLNNKGFAITSIIYGVMILFFLVIAALLGLMLSRASRNDRLATSTKTNLETYSYTIDYEINNGNSYTIPYTGRYNFTINGTNRCYAFFKANDTLSISDSKLYIGNELYENYFCDSSDGSEINSITIDSAYSQSYKGLDKSNANSPDLLDGLIPINFDDTYKVWRVADKSNTNSKYKWYDYDNKMWANAATVNKINQATDLFGNGYNASLDQSDSKNPSIEKNYLEFDGTDDYINLSDKTNFNFKGSSFTIAFTFSPDFTSIADGKYARVFGNYYYGTPGTNRRIYLEMNKKEITGGGAKNVLNFVVNQSVDYTNHICVLRTDDIGITFNNAGDIVKVVITYSYNNDEFIMYLNDYNTSISCKGNSEDQKLIEHSLPIIIGAQKTGTSSYNQYANMKLYDFNIINSSPASEEEIKRYFSDGYFLLNNFSSYTSGLHYNFYNNYPLGMPISDNAFDTMFTWIPRYKYKLFNVDYDTNNNIKIKDNVYEISNNHVDIEFENEKYSTGNVTCDDNYYSCKADNSSDSWYTHPAFKDSSNKDIRGLWIGKYELSENNNNYQILPGKDSKNNTSMINFYDNILRMSNDNNIYGFNSSEMQSRMITNLEWGAVGYFAYSKYGKNLGCNDSNIGECKIVSYGHDTPNGTKTGAGDYITRTDSSTTNNVYGIYDLYGSKWEFTAGVGKGSNLSISSKYDEYILANSENKNLLNGILGDGTSEIYGLSGNRNPSSGTDGHILPYGTNYIIYRGQRSGDSDSTSSTMFSTKSATNSPNSLISTRVVLNKKES